MSQKTDKAIRRAAIKYARKEELSIAKLQMAHVYALPLRYRIIYALGVVFRWGKI